jgi:hypothetical protein
MTEQHRHGSAYDRGSADAYYGRAPDPHYFVGDTYVTKRVSKEDMTQDEIDTYLRGYNNETDRKDWGFNNDLFFDEVEYDTVRED